MYTIRDIRQWRSSLNNFALLVGLHDIPHTNNTLAQIIEGEKPLLCMR